jgi:predicted O-methyltransferase YrrM
MRKRLDFLFIDGDHTYEGVKQDFEMYTPLVRKGGLVAMHDIVPPPAYTRLRRASLLARDSQPLSH